MKKTLIVLAALLISTAAYAGHGGGGGGHGGHGGHGHGWGGVGGWVGDGTSGCGNVIVGYDRYGRPIYQSTC